MILKIIVPVKMITVVHGSPYRHEKLEVLLDEKNVSVDMNSYDLAALEEARRLKETSDDIHVTAVTAGPERTVKALQIAYGMGADELLWVNSPLFKGGDEMELAGLLAGVISKLGFDLILCGLRSDDVGTGMVGIGLAEVLGVPAVTRSLYIERTPGSGAVRVYRHIGRGNQELVECPLPAVITVERSHRPPRYPGVARYLAARRKITACKGEAVSHFSAVPVRLVEMNRARPRPKKIFTPDDNLTAAEKMKLIMSGGITRKKSKKMKDRRSGSEQLFDFLVEKGFIKKSRGG